MSKQWQELFCDDCGRITTHDAEPHDDKSGVASWDKILGFRAYRRTKLCEHACKHKAGPCTVSTYEMREVDLRKIEHELQSLREFRDRVRSHLDEAR